MRNWHCFWYYYHSRSSFTYMSRIQAGWGNDQDQINYTRHIHKALHHRAKWLGIPV